MATADRCRKDAVPQLKRQLEEVLDREVRILREVLSSLETELQALMTNDTSRMKMIMEDRSVLLETMEQIRQRRLRILRELRGSLTGNWDHFENDDPGKALVSLSELLGEDAVLILTKRDQALSLLEQIKNLTQRNSYLTQNKIHTTRALIQRLQPKDPNQTYDKGGHCRKKASKVTTALINREV